MKIALLLLVTIVTLTHANTLDTIRAECRKKFPVSDEDLKKLSKEFSDFPDTDLVRGYLLCYMEQLGIFSATDGLNIDLMVDSLSTDADKTKLKAEVAPCAQDKNEPGSATDVWCFRVLKCIMDSKYQELLRAGHKQDEAK